MFKKSGPRLADRALPSILSSVTCVLIGLILGFICLCFLSWLSLIREADEGTVVTFSEVVATAYNYGFKQILLGGFYLRPLGVGMFLAEAGPLIMTGLSVAFAFKTGLFNIGAAGQFTLGAYGGLLFAIIFGMPWYICLLAATLFGALWGAIPGLFKAFLNINEVISSIMFNWIGLYFVNTLMYGNGTGAMYDSNATKTWALRNNFPDAVIPDFGMAEYFQNRSTTIAVFLAIIVAIIVYFVIEKTTFGYELKACGHNKNAAKYAGIDDKRNIILSMFISGALAGFGGGLYYLAGVSEWSPLNSTALPALGFDGIAVALLASSHPLGTIFSALFISHISTGGSFMRAAVFPPEIAGLISGIIIYLCAFSSLFSSGFKTLFSGKSKTETATPLPKDDAEPPYEEAKAQPSADTVSPSDKEVSD